MSCVIRKWRISDRERLAEMLNNPKVLDNLRDGLPYPYTPADGEEYIASMLAADETRTFAFAITVDGGVIGSVGEPYWGKGYTTSAVEQVCRYVFDHSDILRIFAEPFARNTASCRVLEKAGFQFEGTLRGNAVKNGEVLDMKLYALVRA